MDTALIVAIVSGIVALASVIITSIVTLLSTKRTKQAEKETEQYKLILEQVREQRRIGKDMVLNQTKIFGQACTHIQLIRDNARRLPIDQEIAEQLFAEIKDAAESLFHLYQQFHFLVTPLEARILHDAKDEAHGVSRACKEYIEGGEHPYNPDELLQSLHNAQKLLIREYQKWNSFLLHMDTARHFNTLFPIVDGTDSFSETTSNHQPSRLTKRAPDWWDSSR